MIKKDKKSTLPLHIMNVKKIGYNAYSIFIQKHSWTQEDGINHLDFQNINLNKKGDTK